MFNGLGEPYERSLKQPNPTRAMASPEQHWSPPADVTVGMTATQDTEGSPAVSRFSEMGEVS